MVATRIKKDPIQQIEQLSLGELQARLAAIAGMPNAAVPILAAAVYYYLPFPPAVVTAWHQSVRELRGLVRLVLALQHGPEGENADYARWAQRVLSAFVALGDVPNGIDEQDKPLVGVDPDGNPVAFYGRDPEVWSAAPTRVKGHFLLVGATILEACGISRQDAFGLLRDVLRIVEGAGVAPGSVKRAFNRAHRAYERAFPLKPIDLTRLDQVVQRPRGRYVLVHRPTGAVRARPAATGAANAVPDSPAPKARRWRTHDVLTRWKSMPAFLTEPTGPMARWLRTGRAPTPDELPFKLSPAGREAAWKMYAPLASPPAVPAATPRPAKKRPAPRPGKGQGTRR